MMDTFNGALTLNQTLLHNLRESPYVVQRGLLVVLLVGLLVGGVSGVRQILGGLNPAMQIAQVRQELDQALTQQALEAQTPAQREAVRLISENVEPALAIALAVGELPTPLPHPVGAIFQGLGVLASQPLSYLGSLLVWVVFTHIAARWLGGQGNIQQMLGLGALAVAPHVLDALAFIPFLGLPLWIVTVIWDTVIFVTATSVAHRLTIERSVLAVLLFPLLGGVLALLGCCLLFFGAVALGAGAGA